MNLTISALLLNFGAVAGAMMMRIEPHQRSTISFRAAPFLMGLGTLAGFAAIGLFLYDKGVVEGGIFWAVSAFAFSFIAGVLTRIDGVITIGGLAAIVAGCILAVSELF
jgi:hypothetical protein